MSEPLALGLLLAAAATAGVPRIDLAKLSLARAAAMALAHSATSGEAAASREAAESGRALAHDAFGPQVVVKATPGYASGLPVAVIGEVPGAAGIDVRETIYDPFLRADELEASARLAEASGSLADTRQAVVQRAAELYESVRIGEVRLAARTEILGSRKSLASRSAALASEGRLAPIEADRARLESDLADAARAQTAASLFADTKELGDLVGLQVLPPLSDDPLQIVAEPDDTVSAVDADPTLSALGQAIDLFERSEHTRNRLFAPTVAGEAQYIRLSDSYGYDKYFNHFKADDFTVGIAIAIPLWTGGAARDATRRTSAERQILEYRRRQRRENLELTRLKARAELDQTRRRLDLSRRARELAERDLARTRTLESDGRGDPAAVAKADIALGEARESEADAELSALRARLAALACDGLLSPERFGRTDLNP